MQRLNPTDAIQVPLEIAHCASCRSLLFSNIPTYFVDSGEPLDEDVVVGCCKCDAEVEVETREKVTVWIHQNYRIKTSQ